MRAPGFTTLQLISTFLFFFGLLSESLSQPSATLLQKSPDAAKLADAVETRGHASIIVEFASSTPSQLVGADKVVLAAAARQIRSTRDSVISWHFGDPRNPRPGQTFDRALHLFDVFPLFAAAVNKVELELLAGDPRVIAIRANGSGTTLLNQTIPLIGMPPTGKSVGAFALGATGQGQAIAILDTGIWGNHPFLQGKIILEACRSNNLGAGGVPDQNGIPLVTKSLCPNGMGSQEGEGSASPISPNLQCLYDGGQYTACTHGTQVAGIAAGNNTSPSQTPGSPPTGVAKDASIIAVQVFSMNTNPLVSCGGLEPSCLVYSDLDVLSGLEFVYNASIINNLPNGIKLAAVNLSIGNEFTSHTSSCDDTSQYTAAINSFRSAGVAVVIASGNKGWKNAVASPACVSAAVAVASSTKSDDISCFSSISTLVALMAPGGFDGGYDRSRDRPNSVVPPPPCFGGTFDTHDVHSSFPSDPPDNYIYNAGTSFAAPHVSGAFAAIRSAVPSATIENIVEALQQTGKKIHDSRLGGSQTVSRIQVDAAVQLLMNELLVKPPLATVATGVRGGSFVPSSFNFSLSGSKAGIKFSILGVPRWLTSSSMSGVAYPSGTMVSLVINSNANTLAPGTYSATVTFKNDTNNVGSQSYKITLTVSSPSEATLGVSPSTGTSISGYQAGPFTPNSVAYLIATDKGAANYSISGLPNWLTASVTSGTAITSSSSVTFSINQNTTGLTPGTYNATIAFTNTSSGKGNQIRAFALTVNPKPVAFQGLSSLMGDVSTVAGGISADGKVVVGYSNGQNGGACNTCQAVRWVSGAAPIGLGFLSGGTWSQAVGTNADGSIIAGQGAYPSYSYVPFRWTNSAGGTALTAQLPPMGSSVAVATGVSADGSTVVGTPVPYQGFRWVNNGDPIGLGFLAPPDDGSSYANGTNSDGSVVVGSGCASTCKAIRWVRDNSGSPSGGTMTSLGIVAGYTRSDAFAVNADGTVVVGSNGNANARQAFRWVKDNSGSASGGTMTLLPSLNGDTVNDAYAVNADGTVIVGDYANQNGAFRWTAMDGIRSIADVLTVGGINLTGWTLLSATGVSADGTVIVGQGTFNGVGQAWMATLPLP